MAYSSNVRMNSPSEVPEYRDVQILGHKTFGLHGTLKFKPHEHIFCQGNRPTGKHQILSGIVIPHRLMCDGRRQIQDFARAGDLLALSFTEEDDVSAEALIDVEVLFGPQVRFVRAFATDSDVRSNCFIAISRMLRSARAHSVWLGQTAMEPVAGFLLFLQKRFGRSSQGFSDIPMSRRDSADDLRLTLETVSRTMNRLKRDRGISLPRTIRFQIEDHFKLKQLSGDMRETLMPFTSHRVRRTSLLPVWRDVKEGIAPQRTC